MGYHINKITKGILGEFSKITEEYLELQDAIQQNHPLMALCECADLIGAIELYAANYNVSLDDLIKMKKSNKGAFLDGTRK